MSAESHYLNALEALDEGDRELARTEAKSATALDPEHIEAWSVYVDASLPPQGAPPNMIQAGRALAGIKNIIALEPNRVDMWLRGGRIMADDLGMLHDALHWWKDCHDQNPEDVTPVVESASILADMGEYEMASERLQSILNDNMDVGMTQFRKINSLLQLVKQAATQQQKDIFRPEQRRHDGWGAIQQKMKKPPMSENFLFLVSTVPFLLLVFFLAPRMAQGGWFAFCLNTIVIMMIVLIGMRNAKRWFQIVNRPAFNLLRAMNFEASTGYTVVPEEVRTSVLYMYIMQRKPLAWQERMLKIIDKGTPLPKSWRARYPTFSAAAPFWNDDAETEGSKLQAYEEE